MTLADIIDRKERTLRELKSQRESISAKLELHAKIGRDILALEVEIAQLDAQRLAKGATVAV